MAAYRPYLTDYAGAIKAGATAISLTIFAALASWTVRNSHGVICGVPLSVIPGLFCAALCVVASAHASRFVASAARRRWGFDVEARAIAELQVSAAHEGWSVEVDGHWIPGVGNVDALLHFGSGGAVVEIKSYGLRVLRGAVVRSNGSNADKEFEHVLAQQAAVGYQFMPVLWCPNVRRASAALAGSVLVVTGSADDLVLALRRFA